MSGVNDRDRIRSFGRELENRVAARVVETPVGDALFVDELFDVYSLNYLRADRGDAATIAASADRTMETFQHRNVSTYLDVELGWARETHLVLQHLREPDRRVDTKHVRRVPFGAIAESRMHEYDRGFGERLNKAQLRVADAVDTHWLAAYAGDVVAGWCHVRSRDGVAQIEDVNTLPAFRGRGFGRAIVQHALDEARPTHDIVFLEALEHDWPRELYAKLGFVEIDRSYHHLRAPNPLTALRITTPRLELRLATLAELRALYRVAEEGVHDPAWMPFEVPWTDSLDEAGFVAYHLDSIAAWRPEEWRLNLITFHDGQPMGSQGLTATLFPATKTVVTGSWLGLAYQGHGFGTEMRSAMLRFAFEALGATKALSGALEGNAQSLGVSRKLGYREVGSHSVSPRGAPVEHTDLELTPADFKPLTHAEWAGFKPELFGL